MVKLVEGCFQLTRLGNKTVSDWQWEAEKLLQRIERERGLCRGNAENLLSQRACSGQEGE